MGGVAKLHEIDYESLTSQMKGGYDIKKILNVYANSFWRVIDLDLEFWESLSVTPEAHELMEYVEENFDEVFFLSSPSMSPNCYFGKCQWIIDNFPKYRTKIILTNDKHLLAGKNRLLIDDNDDNCKKFKAAGGKVVLFPRPWNSKHNLSDHALYNVKQLIRLS